MSLKCLYIIYGFEALAGTLNFRQDVVARLFPDIGFRVQVAYLQIGGDRLDQVADTGKAALADDVLGQVAEEAFHQIHPRTGRGGEMHHQAINPLQAVVPLIAPPDPVGDGRVFVSCVMVGNQVQTDIRRRLPVELFQKGQPLAVGVLGRGLTEDLPVQGGQGGKERDRAVSLIVMRLRPTVAAHDGQTGLGPF